MERIEARLLRIDQAIERLDGDLVAARVEADDRLDDRMRSFRQEWKIELVAFRREWKDELVELVDARDRAIDERIAAAIRGSAEGLSAAVAAASAKAIEDSEKRITATITARNQVPGWFAALSVSVSPSKLVQYGTAISIATAAILGTVVPAAIALIQSCHGVPPDYRPPPVLPSTFGAEQAEPSDP